MRETSLARSSLISSSSRMWFSWSTSVAVLRSEVRSLRFSRIEYRASSFCFAVNRSMFSWGDGGFWGRLLRNSFVSASKSSIVWSSPSWEASWNCRGSIVGGLWFWEE